MNKDIIVIGAGIGKSISANYVVMTEVIKLVQGTDVKSIPKPLPLSLKEYSTNHVKNIPFVFHQYQNIISNRSKRRKLARKKK